MRIRDTGSAPQTTLRFNFVAGSRQEALQKHFNLYSGFPALVLYQPKKVASTNYVGAFDFDHIKEFLGNALVGKQRLYASSPSSASLIPAVRNAMPSIVTLFVVRMLLQSFSLVF